MKNTRKRLSTWMSLLLSAVLCVQCLPVTVTAEAADKPTPYIIIDEGTVPDTGYYGNGSDGALYISSGQTVTLPVAIPHQSIVQKNYTSITIEYGGTLRCAAPNAGLILRVQGNVNIYGTIDQSGMAPVTNPNNKYTYPPEISCGAGGNGGDNRHHELKPELKPLGGIAMPSRKYGGGYGGGGSGGSAQVTEYAGTTFKGGNGGDANAITTLTNPPLFVGGAASPPNSSYAAGQQGFSGGGGSGGKKNERGDSSIGNSGKGGNAPGENGQDANTTNHSIYTMAGGGGGAGNMGGGVVMLYAGGTVTISDSGLIDCSGDAGGNGGWGGNWLCTGNSDYLYGSGGAGGGGGGGGSVYIRYGKAFSGTAQLNVAGGAGGTGGLVHYIWNSNTGAFYDHSPSPNGFSGSSGAVSVAKAPDITPPTISSVKVSTSWGLTNTATITATDDMSGIVSYAVTSSPAVPGSGSWQSGNSFTLSVNGTYYAWARDAVGNVNAGYSFAVSKIDNAAPVVTSATVTPAGWVGSGTKTITVTATDSQSGVDGYGITTTNTAPTTWQTGNTFSKAAGSYYVWVRDKVGKVSSSKSTTVDSIDTTAPVVTSATVTPAGWVGSGTKTITVTATDSQSGVDGYGITTTNTAPTTWQTGNTFSKAAGSYYVWARDKVGNVSAARQVKVENLDDVKPVISGVTLPENWGQSNTAVINASDVGSGVNIYAVSSTGSAPGDGWQPERSFTLTENGTYYAWCKDKAGNISASFSFVVTKVDTDLPVVTDAVVTPAGWAASGVKTITVTADDSQSGILGYGIATAATPPNNWQDDNIFTKPLGTYYVWARDNAGNVSAARQVAIENIDDVKPVVSGVTLPENWGQSNTAVVNASDVGNGLKDYAVSRENTVPSDGWQTERSFTLTDNGIYYAWARDKADNLSDSFSFEVSRVDTDAPVISTAAVTPVGWTGSGTKTITVTAADAQSGVTHYGITATDTAPTAWQPGNTFVKPAGTYCLWAKDKSGRISEPVQAVVDGIDTDKPIVTEVKITPGWGTSTEVLLSAADSGSGIKEYAVSEYRFAPGTGWQASASFTLSKNGDYYAFAKDSVGNTSEGLPFTPEKVDTAKPTVTKVSIAPGFSSCVIVELEASDVGSGVKDYAVFDSSSAPAAGWQTAASFTVEKNGSYYAFARDNVDNVSAGKFFNITKVDKLPPTIASIGYSSDNSTIMIRGKDNESSVVAIYIDGISYPGSTVSWDIPAGTRYIRLQAEDEAGNRSKEEIHRVRGWYDLLDSITIEPVEFKDDNRKAVVTGKTTGEGEITGIYINGRLQKGNPVTYMISAGMEYLELQAEDAAGDRSKLYRVRVPDWSQEIAALSIVDVRFAPDNGSAQVTAMSTGGIEVRGIRVNGELQPGNPITYEIPAGTTHLKLQAEDMNGDRSAVLIRRVPGWSEVVTTLTVTDVTFTDYNTTAQITATATGGDSVAGIIVNDKAYEGNPIIYTVPKDTQTLHIQAYNPRGDRSPMVNKAVPMDSSKSTLKLSIEHPEWTKSRSARVKLIAEDKNRITKILVRTGEDAEWAEVTEKRYIDITADTTVYATVENDKGESKEVSQDIECFDRTAPTVTATQDGKTVNIRAADNKSGVTSILINNKEYQRGDFEEGKLAYRIPEGTTMVIIKAEDAAGNLSRAVELPIQNTSAALPVIIAPTPAPKPTPELPVEEAAIPEHEPSPTPTPEPEAEASEPEQSVAEAAAQPEPLPPAAQAAVAVGGVGSTAAGGIWYWLRKKAMNKPIEELELMGKKLLYDESEFGGSIDPLDKLNQGGKEDV